MVGELTTEAAYKIRSEFVDTFVRDRLPNAPNKLRAINDCVNGLDEKLKKEGFPNKMLPLHATIGDINPWEIGFDLNREPDRFELEFADLADKLCLDPEGENFEKLQQNDRAIRIAYKKRAAAVTRYNPQGGKGTLEVREIAAKEARQIGIKADTEQIWMGYGGLPLLESAATAINVFFEENYQRKAKLLSPSVGFSVVLKAIKDNGTIVKTIDSSDLPRNELTAQRLEKYLEESENPPPDIMLLTPANNPNAQVYDPDTFSDFLTKMQEINRNVIFLFDMAYMWTIPREKSQKLIEVIYETGAYDRSMFVNSLSKKAARPGSRLANIVIPDSELGKIFHYHNIVHNPTWSGDLDVLYQALDMTVDEKAYGELSRLFRQRQKALLEVLMDLDPQERYFKNLASIRIPGYESDGTIEQDVPLFLWLELQEGVSAFDVLKSLNVGGIPSEVFGPPNEIGADKNHIRFSVGFSSTSDILSRSDVTLTKWLNK